MSDRESSTNLLPETRIAGRASPMNSLLVIQKRGAFDRSGECGGAFPLTTSTECALTRFKHLVPSAKRATSGPRPCHAIEHLYTQESRKKLHTQQLQTSMAVPGGELLDSSLVSLSNGVQQGEYYVGPPVQVVNASPVRTIKEHLAKRVDSNEFVTMKILSLSPSGESQEDQQGKILLHNEHSILSLLQTEHGIIHHHGLYREPQKIILVLDCLHPHDYDNEGLYEDLINLQQYVIKEKRLHEKDTLQLFLKLLSIVQTIHKKNIVHRDLKLGNIILNKRTKELTLVNFALGKHLVSEDDRLTDQRGSLAYVSPDVLSGNAYEAKPSDMWSLGVLLYTMLYGQFPFYDSDPQELFRKIRVARFTIPKDGNVSVETTCLLRQLMEVDPQRRLTVSTALETVQSILSRMTFTILTEPVQIVPEMNTSGRRSEYMVPDQDNNVLAQLAGIGLLDLNTSRLSFEPQANGTILIHTGSPHSIPSPSSSPSPAHFFSFFSDSPRAVGPVHTPPLPSANPFICSSPAGVPHLPSAFPVTTLPSSTVGDSAHSLPTSFFSTHRVLRTSPLDSPTEGVPEVIGAANYHHLHPHGNLSSLPQPTHRHSFSEGEHPGQAWIRSQLGLPAASPGTGVLPYHGRRSLGSMMGNGMPRQRRSSHQSRSASSLIVEQPRVRRRSQEAGDDQRELLENLQSAAMSVTRRTSPVSLRVYGPDNYQ